MSSRTKTAKNLIVSTRARTNQTARSTAAGCVSVQVRETCLTDINFPPVPTEPAEIERDASFDYCVSELP